MIYLGLCETTGVMARPWAEAGYRCICVDIANDDRTEDGIEYWKDDVLRWFPVKEQHTDFAFVAAFPPCTHLAGSGARWWRDKGWQAASEGVALVAACDRMARWCDCPYMIENPVGRLSNFHKPDYIFNPCDYGGYLDPPGDAYTKKTCLWTGGGFVMPEPKPVDPVEGSKMHLMPPGPDRAAKRSVTPEGFARAVFEANHKAVAT